MRCTSFGNLTAVLVLPVASTAPHCEKPVSDGHNALTHQLFSILGFEHQDKIVKQPKIQLKSFSEESLQHLTSPPRSGTIQ